MKIELTRDIRKPFPNGYPSMMITFEKGKEQKHVRFTDGGMNWLPKHDEIFKLLDLLYEFEDMRYPRSKGLRGSRMLIDEINKRIQKTEAIKMKYCHFCKSNKKDVENNICEDCKKQLCRGGY